MSHDTLDHAADVFLAVRDRLFGIAFRILNNCAEAEDIVQEAWLRWQTCDRSVVLDPPAFLSTTTKRLCINAMQSARARREIYTGPWLPDAVDTSADPQLDVERDEALKFAALTLLERLSPTERAAYVLREAFGYAYSDIAVVVSVSVPNARQLVSRARKHLAIGRCEPASGHEHKRLHMALAGAARAGDLATLENVFTQDVALAA
jgi:RNA polymerase sigma-70 factor (ECF subfamily)